MEILTYLIKVNIAIGLFYGFYALFFRNDTFFQWKRILLLSVFFLCVLYPFWDISQQMIKSKIWAHAIQNGAVFPTYYLNEVIITAQTKPHSLWNYVPEILTGIYYLGAFALILWMLVQIVGVISMIFQTPVAEINGQKVHLKKGLKTPFSFFGYIVLDSEPCNENELYEILRHEKTHVRQWHSLDVIISDLMCAVCWFNPFIWLLKRELRINLEYLADRSVIHSGCDTEHYQFHLLRLSYHKAAATIINNFNFSPLKKRIFMMNKKQTSSISIVKYTLVIPLFTALLFFNSCLKTDKQQGQEPASEPEVTTIAIGEPSPNEATEKQSTDAKIWEIVEQIPQFPGGDGELLKWLADNIEYPQSAIDQSITGTVIMKFVVLADGSIGDVEIVKGLDPACDKAAALGVKKMPKWAPGRQKGEAVNVWYRCPIRFRLQ
ncbi:cell envelope biogenesis protein TonB [Bacteroidia bacterium]|nr:cell envelope biogenesis protein TonB [Bacteroidia bacterium]GHT28886.1 cell envelope biogenesis protein TonB [Bacteroidia bacterium]